MTYLATLRDNMTGLNYVFASDSIPKIEKEVFECILTESGFFKEGLEIREYNEFSNILDSITSSGKYTICRSDYSYESFYLTICTPEEFIQI